ncbi:MAG: Ig-like domain-containing protein [Terracidiphilus sp.]
MTPASPSIAKGTTQQFTATGTYSDGSTQNLTASVTWNSDTPAVATIATSGLATGVAAGSANIFAISGSITGSTAINVTQAQVVSIAVTPAIPSIPLGTTQQFTATGTYTDNSTQDLTDTVQWSSSNAAVATISDSVGSFGLATSKAAGSTNITATSGSVYGSTTLAVSSAELLLITVNPADPSIALGTTQQFTATGTYTDSAMQDLTSTAAWSSDATSIATIDSMGLAQTVGAGTATITATVGTVSGTTILTAAPSALISIAVAPPSPSIPLGTTQAFSATGDYADGSMQDLTSTVHWSTSDSTVATISNASGTYGVATSVAVGSVDVTAASGSISGTASLSVTPASLVSISVTPVNPTIALGRSQQFAATGTYTDKSTKDITTNVTWTSSSALVAVVSNSTGSQGLATSSGVGTATITAKMGSVSGSTGLAVGSPQLVSIAVTPANPSIPAGTTEQFSAMGSYTDNSTANLTGSVTWTSTSTAVATIGSGGIATGASRGATTITATSGSVTGSTTMTVIAPALISVTISPASPAVAQGATTQLTATGVYSDNSTQVLTATATWSSSNTAIATVSNSSGTQGLAAGVAPSSVTITAAVGAVQGTATLTVNAANPALVLGIHANTDNGASSSTTVAVNLGTPTAGSTIACSLAFSNSTAFTSVTDNVNSGSYFPAASLMREPKRNYIDGIYYHENVAASATKVTLTYTPAEAHGRMACVEIKNTPTAYALDSSFVAGQAASAANPTAGTSLTPNMNGEFVYAGLSSDGGTNSAGPNYTLLNPMTGTSSTQWVPEYWIQNTKTSTNGHYTNATVADYGDQMAAWAPQQPGSCGVSAVIDWGGGTNGNTPAVADLEASTHGDYSQPNADRAMTSDEDAPGVWHAYANGITYNTNAYVPLQTTRNCPFYSGSGTTAAQVGLDQPTSNTGNDPETLIFDTPAETVTAWICMEGTMPTSVRGTDDVFLIGRAENNDYANIQWNSNGSTTSWELETKGGTPSTTVGWKQNTWYGFSLTYSGNGGNHSLSVYSFPSPKCQGTATLMQTITAQGVGAGPADSIRVFGTYANEYPSGYHWYMGAILLDYLYGSQLLP